MSKSERVKVLVLPVYRRYVLFHAWEEPLPAATAAALRDSLQPQAARNLEERVQVYTNLLSTKVHSLLVRQWQNLREAKPRTLKNWLYRLAQGVLSREEPEESFLKAVPKALESVEVIYPASLREREVRRKIRHLLHAQRARLRSRLWTYSALSVPLVPLLATPVPNIPLYYCGYKAYSAAQALGGCAALRRAWAEADAAQLGALRARLLQLQEASGALFAPGSWPARLIAPTPGYRQRLENAEARIQEFYRGKPPGSLVPRFEPSARLDELCSPAARAELSSLCKRPKSKNL